MLLLFTLLPLGMLGYLAIRWVSDTAKQATADRVEASAQSSGTLLGLRMSDLESVVESFSQRPPMRKAFEAKDGIAIRTQLSLMMDSVAGTEVVYASDATGRLLDVLPETPDIVGKDFSYRDWFKGLARTGKPYISELYESAAAGNPRVAAVSSYVRDGSGKPVGVVVAAFGRSALQSFVEDIAEAQGAEVGITDQRGMAVASSSRFPVSPETRRGAPGVAAALRGRTGSITSAPGGTPTLTGYAPVPEIGWTVTVSSAQSGSAFPAMGLGPGPLLLVILLMLMLATGMRSNAVAVRRLRRLQVSPKGRTTPAVIVQEPTSQQDRSSQFAQSSQHNPARAASTAVSIETLGARGERSPATNGALKVSAPDPQTQSLQSIMAAVWIQSREVISGRVTLLEEAVVSLLGREFYAEQRREAEREAHKLAGSLGSFGLAEGSRLAKQIEWMLQGSQQIGGDDVLKLSELVMFMGKEVERGPAQASDSSPVAVKNGNSILIVDSDGELAQRVVEVAVAQGLKAKVALNASEALVKIAKQRPDLVILNPGEDGPQVRALLDELRSGTDPTPVLVVALPGADLDRASAARFGACGYLEKPVSPKVIVESVERILSTIRHGATVLLVDDDPAISTILRPLIGAKGFRVEAIEDPLKFWNTLETVRPDLLVLDFDLPHLNGIQLCRMVRNDSAWAQLPIIFLSGSTGEDLERDMYLAGADDVIRKPIDPQDIVVRISNRIERSRSGRELTKVDLRTGLPNWPGFVHEFESLLGLARRYSKPVALVAMQVDSDQGGDDDHPAAGDAALLTLVRVLRRSLAAEDSLGMYNDSTVMVALYDMKAGEAVERMAQVLETLAAEEVLINGHRAKLSGSGGVSVFPAAGTELEALATSASEALAAAQGAGGNRIHSWLGTDTKRDTFDVLLVDDDEAIAALLMHALRTRGYKALWISDGAEAAHRLTGADGISARVILLDVGLPGLDGLSVLRDLAHRSLLNGTRVIMLTLRSSEKEVLQSLELGAYDHVAKPFSIAVLLQKVRLALDSLPHD